MKNGPVMIGGPQDQSPAHWLLATGLTGDGNGVIAVDPISGRLVVVSYDPDSKTLGSFAGIYDPKTKGLVQLAAAGGSSLPNGADATLEKFVPLTFLAVSIK